MLSRRSTFLCNIFLPTTRACCYSTTATTTTVSSTNTYSKSQRAHIQDSAEELNNFSVDNFIQQQEQQQKQAPPRIGKADIRPSLSQAQKDRYLKNPYKLDKRGNPVWDYYKLKAFRPSRYPAIETEQIFTPKQPRYEYLVKSAQDVANKHEFRNHVTSEELLAAGVSLDKTQASNKVAQIFDWKNANKGEQAALKKQTAIARFQIHPSDTGSAPAQSMNNFSCLQIFIFNSCRLDRNHQHIDQSFEQE